jgi:hypothetical protein
MEETIQRLYISEKIASHRYGYSESWFQRSRWAGNGPKFLKIQGRVLYPLKETDTWFSQHGLRQSTSK